MKKVEYFALVSKIGKEIKAKFGEFAFSRIFSEPRKRRADYRSKYWCVGDKTSVKIAFIEKNYGDQFIVERSGGRIIREGHYNNYLQPGVALFPKFNVN